ncbi:fibronectin type III domain-containing protein [Candidatus Daviesbacteria bacterium]|nr:fibronectin type III domain-containing protein [Candidatus Daviesbacteria bacterium]
MSAARLLSTVVTLVLFFFFLPKLSHAETISSYNGSQEHIYSLAEYNGKLYAGQGAGGGDGDIYVCTSGINLTCDPSDWAISYNGTQEAIYDLVVFNGKLYAGQGDSTGDGDVLVFDGTSWTTSFNGSQERIYSLVVFNNKLYAGQGSGGGDGDIFVCNPATSSNSTSCEAGDWTKSYEGGQNDILSLAVFNNKLYAGQGSGGGDGDVLVFDGTSWTTSYNGAQETIRSLGVFSGKLYAGVGLNGGDGDILKFDGTSWSTSYDGGNEEIRSFAVYNNRLYAGQGVSGNDAIVLVCNPGGTTCDPGDWSQYENYPEETIDDLIVFNDKLYGGQGKDTNNGDIFIVAQAPGAFTLEQPTAICKIPPPVIWSTSFDSSHNEVNNPTAFNNKLYVGEGTGNNEGDIWACNPGTNGLCDQQSEWTKSYDGPDSKDSIEAIEVLKDRLYAGEGSQEGDGDTQLLNSSGTSWSKVHDPGSPDQMRAFVEYKGKLYSGTGGGDDEGDLYVCTPAADGSCTSWSKTKDFGSGIRKVESLLAYNEYLYVGLGNQGGDSDVQRFDGTTWTKVYDGSVQRVKSLIEYNGILYLGLEGGANEGDIMACNPGPNGACDSGEWNITAFDGNNSSVDAMTIFENKLYIVEGTNVRYCTLDADGICNTDDWINIDNFPGDNGRGIEVFQDNLYVAGGDKLYLGTPNPQTNPYPSITLDWSASLGLDTNSRPASDYYEVYRSTNGIDYSFVASTGATSYVDENSLLPNTLYYYYIRAVNQIGSINSNSISILSTNCDTIPPSGSISLVDEECYTKVTFPNPLKIYAQDDYKVTEVTYNLRGPIDQNGSASLGEGSAQAGYWYIPNLVNNLINGYYRLQAHIKDIGGNTSGTQPRNFTIADKCKIPFLETTGGNIHSNESIDLP